MPYILKKYYPARHLAFFFGEGILIFFVIGGSYLYFVAESWPTAMPLLIGKAILVTIIFQFCFYLFDLYDLSLPPVFADNLTRVFQAFGIGCMILALVYFIFPAVMISTKVFWLACLVVGGTVTLWRFFYSLVLDRQLFSQSVVLLGAGGIAESIGAYIGREKDSGYRIVAQVSGRGHNSLQVPTYDDAEHLSRICREHRAEKIVVTLDDKRGQMPIEELMACKLQGLQIVTGIKFYEELAGKILVEKVNPSWIIFSEGFKSSRMTAVAKRVIDVVVSAAGLTATLPLCLLTALVIKLESPGPVFYFQERVGEKGKAFRVVKFRSMRVDAEKDGPVWAGANDHRTTRFGRFIRKIRMDEVPQMWNVLRGEMSCVGPRPERPVFVVHLARMIPYYSLRHNVKPGITGWAQINYPYGASDEDALRKLEYDLYYIKNMSLRMDLGIIFMTAKTVLFRQGSR